MVVSWQRGFFTVTVAGLLCTISASVWLATVIGQEVDAVQAHDMPRLWTVAWTLLAAVAMLVAAQGAVRYSRILLGARIANRLRAETLEQLLAAPLAVHDRQKTGDLQTRLNTDIEVVKTAVTWRLTDLLRDPLLLIACLVYLWILNPLLGVVLAMLGVFLYGVNRVYQKPLYTRAKSVRETESALMQEGLETIQGVLPIQAWQAEGRVAKRYRGALERYYAVARQQAVTYNHLWTLTYWIGQFTFTAVLGLGSWLILHRHLAIGTLMVETQLMNYLMGP
jgi:ABC-type multidrug transport system fused ATPase/permease subunit